LARPLVCAECLYFDRFLRYCAYYGRRVDPRDEACDKFRSKKEKPATF